MLEPTPGLVIAGRYRLEEQLGAGGMGSVWLADHLALGSPVAVKLLHAELADESLIARFEAEAKAAATLRSPHVVQILDHGVDGSTPFIVMEKLEGESLGERLLRRPLPDFEETLTILTHTVRAMMRAHEAGIVHRDLKPDNIFLHVNDDEFVAKVLDFGIAKVEPAVLTALSPNTNTGMLIGSPYYMSPEQAEGRRDLDYRSDLWALGIIIYECMTGVLPYYEETLGRMLVKLIKEEPKPPSMVAEVPLGFDEWFKKANHKDRHERFQSAREMLEAFKELRGAPPFRNSAAEIPVGTLPAATPHQVTELAPTMDGVAGEQVELPGIGRSRWPFVAGGALVVLLVSAGLLGLRQSAVEDPDLAEDSAAASRGEDEPASQAAEKAHAEPSAQEEPAPESTGAVPPTKEHERDAEAATESEVARTKKSSATEKAGGAQLAPRGASSALPSRPRPAPRPSLSAPAPRPASTPAPTPASRPNPAPAPAEYNPLDQRF